MELREQQLLKDRQRLPFRWFRNFQILFESYTKKQTGLTSNWQKAVTLSSSLDWRQARHGVDFTTSGNPPYCAQ